MHSIQIHRLQLRHTLQSLNWTFSPKCAANGNTMFAFGVKLYVDYKSLPLLSIINVTKESTLAKRTSLTFKISTLVARKINEAFYYYEQLFLSFVSSQKIRPQHCYLSWWYQPRGKSDASAAPWPHFGPSAGSLVHSSFNLPLKWHHRHLLFVPRQKIDLKIITYYNDISLGAKVMPRLRLGFTLAPRLAPWLWTEKPWWFPEFVATLDGP